MPEEYFSLKPKEAIVFRTIAGHLQGYWKDLVTLDTFMAEGVGTKGFEEVAVVHHTGKLSFWSCSLGCEGFLLTLRDG